VTAVAPPRTAPTASPNRVTITYRVQIGGRYMDADGNLHPRGVHNPDSPNYHAGAANDTIFRGRPMCPYPGAEHD